MICDHRTSLNGSKVEIVKRVKMMRMKTVFARVVLLVLVSPQLVHSMDNKEETFNSMDRPVKSIIFEDASFHTKPGDLRLVCKNWQETIDGKENTPSQVGTSYATIGPIWRKCIHAWYGAKGHEDVLNNFLKGKLVYKSPTDTTIEWKISDLKNPFAGMFKLSEWEDKNKVLAIKTGIHEKNIDPKNNIIELWLAPRFMVEKFIKSSTKHFLEPMMTWTFPGMDLWNKDTAPMGIFYNLREWDHQKRNDYLIHENLASISSRNLYENWCHSRPSTFMGLKDEHHLLDGHGDLLKRFTFVFDGL